MCLSAPPRTAARFYAPSRTDTCLHGLPSVSKRYRVPIRADVSQCILSRATAFNHALRHTGAQIFAYQRALARSHVLFRAFECFFELFCAFERRSASLHALECLFVLPCATASFRLPPCATALLCVSSFFFVQLFVPLRVVECRRVPSRAFSCCCSSLRFCELSRACAPLRVPRHHFLCVFVFLRVFTHFNARLRATAHHCVPQHATIRRCVPPC